MGYTIPNEPGSWQYRIPISYSNAGGATTGLQFNVLLGNTFNYAACLSGGVDIRITASDGQTILPYFIESWISGTSASIWFKASIPGTGTQTAYLYYGNASGTPIAPSATSVPPIGPWTHSASYITTSGTQSYQYIEPENMINVGGTYYAVFEDRDVSPYTICIMSTTNPAVTTGWTFVTTAINLGGSSNAQSPFLYTDGTTYYIFYWHSDNTIHYATASSVGGTYTDQGTALGKGSTGAWDAAAVYEPCIIPNYNGSGNFAMLYTGSGSGGPGAGNEQIGMATASSITGPWTKNSSNPIIPLGSAGQVDYKFAADSWYGGQFNGLYYIGYTAGAGTANQGNPWGQSYVTTPDWVTFTKAGYLSFAPGAYGRWDNADAHRGHPISVGSNWVQLYIGVISNTIVQGHAGVMTMPNTAVQDIRNNPQDVFNFYDNFPGSSLNPNLWSVGANTTVAVSGGVATFSNTTDGGNVGGVAASQAFPANTVFEAYVNFPIASSGTSSNGMDVIYGESWFTDNSLIVSVYDGATNYGAYANAGFSGWTAISGAPYDTTNYHLVQLFWNGTTFTSSVDGHTATATPAVAYNTAYQPSFGLYSGSANSIIKAQWARVRVWTGYNSVISLGSVQTAPATTTSAPSSGLVPVQIFGRLPNGQIAAVSVDTYGNLAISGGTGGALNTVDVLGNGQATPAMVYGVTPSGKLVAVAVDANGNLCATVGSGGGNPNTTVDISAYTTPTPVQVVGREPTSGKFYAVPLNGSDALYDSVHPGTTTSLSTPGSVPRPIVLCGRAPNGSIVAVALDASGRLCISGSGSSGSVNTVDVFKNGAPLAIQLFGVNASGQLAAVPLDANGNLQLS